MGYIGNELQVVIPKVGSESFQVFKVSKDMNNVQQILLSKELNEKEQVTLDEYIE